MKGGIIAGAVAAAVASAAVVTDRRVRATRRPAIAALDDFTAPEPDRAGFLRADDHVQLYYEQDGSVDAPLTVVLVHGFCQNRNGLLFQRRALLERFGGGIRIVGFDLRSHGRSEHSDLDHATIDQLGADLRTVLDRLVPAGPVVLIGHSLGGMTILALADAHPALFGDRIVGAALIATSTGKLGWLTLGLPAAIARVGEPVMRLALRGVRRQTPLIERGRQRMADASWIFVKRLGFGPGADPRLVEFLTQMIGTTPVDVVADFFPSFTSHDKLVALDMLLDIPVVIVCGEDDLVTPSEHSLAMAERLPKAELVLVPGAGHQVLMERPDLVNPPLLRLVEDALTGGA